jgi:hypothetical protein
LIRNRSAQNPLEILTCGELSGRKRDFAVADGRTVLVLMTCLRSGSTPPR